MTIFDLFRLYLSTYAIRLFAFLVPTHVWERPATQELAKAIAN